MTVSITSKAIGISPGFPVSAEEFINHYRQAVTRIDIDGVEPATLVGQTGYSQLLAMRNLWAPWIDEKIVEPKWDGISVYTGMISNSPTLIKGYYFITLMRAVDKILEPVYVGRIQATIGTVLPIAPPTP